MRKLERMEKKNHDQFLRAHREHMCSRIGQVALGFADNNPLQSSMPKVTAGLCHASVNLKRLGKLLGLSEVERLWVLWAYCCSADHPLELPSVRLRSQAHGLEVLAMLWGLPFTSVQQVATPNRLRGLQILEPPRQGRHDGLNCTLGDLLICSEEFKSLVQQAHYTTEKLWNHFCRGDYYGWLVHFEDEDEQPRVHAWIPPSLKETWIPYKLAPPLNAQQLAALLDWTCNWQLPTQVFYGLSGQLTILEAKEAIRLGFIKASKDRRPSNMLFLLETLYSTRSKSVTHDRHVNADELSALVYAICDWRVPAQQFYGLAEQLTLFSARKAIEIDFLGACEDQRSFSLPCLLDALYFATPPSVQRMAVALGRQKPKEKS